MTMWQHLAVAPSRRHARRAIVWPADAEVETPSVQNAPANVFNPMPVTSLASPHRSAAKAAANTRVFSYS